MMTRRIVAAIAFLAVLALIACDETDEEVRGDDPVSDLTLERVVQRIAQAGHAIESVRIDESRVDRQGDEETTSTRVAVNVGSDSYSRIESEDGVREGLTLNGEMFVRVSEGEWSAEETDQEYLLDLEQGTAPGYDPDLSLVTLEINLNQFLEGESPVVEEEGGLIVVTATSRDLTGLDALLEGPFPYGLPAEQSGLDEFRRELAKMPDEIALTIKLWVSADDFLPQRQEVEATSYRGGEVVQTTRIAAEYSLYNEAELPGPLPTFAN